MWWEKSRHMPPRHWLIVCDGGPIRSPTIRLIPRSTMHLHNFGLMLSQRLWRWLNIRPPLCQCIVFAGVFHIFWEIKNLFFLYAACNLVFPADIWWMTGRRSRHLHNIIPANTKHFYDINTMLGQRRRRWADVVYMLYKWDTFNP